MKKIIKEIEVYNFEELEKDIQENLIEKEMEYQTEAFCEIFLEEEMTEKAKELLQKYFKGKANLKSVYYSLGYCQGDGAMIAFDLTYYNESLQIKQYGHYYHYNSFIIDNNWNISEKRNEKLKDKIRGMNQELEEFGYNLIENCIDEKDIVEMLQENQYLKNGEIYM